MDWKIIQSFFLTSLTWVLKTNAQQKMIFRISYKFGVISRFEVSFENKLLERKKGIFKT